MARPAAAEPRPGVAGNLLKWEELDSWLTPADNFFFVNHLRQPDGLDESTWRVGITGLVARPQSLTLADLKARARHEVDFTLECSGNHGYRTGLSPALSAMPAGRARRWPRCWRRRVSWSRPPKWSSMGLIAAR